MFSKVIAVLALCLGLLTGSCETDEKTPETDYRSNSNQDRSGPIRSNSAEILTSENPVRLNEYGCDSNTWWNEDYRRRYQLLLEPSVGQDISLDQLVSFSLDHEALVDLGFSQADGSDVALVYHSSDCSFQEVEFALDPSSSWANRNSQLWLKAAGPVPEQTVDRHYYIYVQSAAAVNKTQSVEDFFTAYYDFNSDLSTDDFFMLQEGAGLSVANGDLVIQSATTAETQYNPFGIITREAYPPGTKISTRFSVPQRGTANWKATVGVPAELLLLYQRRLQYYTADPMGAIFTDLSEELFPETSYSNQLAEIYIEATQISFALNGSVIATRARDTENFQFRLSFSPDGIVDNFEYRVHSSLIRTFRPGDEAIPSRVINPVLLR